MIGWKKQLTEQLLFGGPMDFQIAVNIKASYIPSRLYKYVNITERQIKNLENNSVYLSCPEDFNDPYDSCSLINLSPCYKLQSDDDIDRFESILNKKFSEKERERLKQGEDVLEVALSRFSDKDFSPKLSREELIKFGKQTYKDYTNEIYKKFEKAVRKSVRISCFTTRRDNMSMWHHYAGGHSGICIEYDTNAANQLFRRLLFPVIYGNSRFDASNFIGTPERPSYNNQFPLYAAIFKSKDWEYENEWRLIIPGGEGDQYQFFVVPIKAVYFGRAISDENKNKILEICRTKGITVFQTDLCDDSNYTLDFKEMVC